MDVEKFAEVLKLPSGGGSRRALIVTAGFTLVLILTIAGIAFVPVGVLETWSRRVDLWKTAFERLLFPLAFILTLPVAFWVFITRLFLTVSQTDQRISSSRRETERQIDSLADRQETVSPVDKNLPKPPEGDTPNPPAGNRNPDYFDALVAINLRSLSAYYDLVQVQTSRSFLASISVGLVGVALIMIGLGIGFFASDATQRLSYISSGAGVLTEFIAGVFFYLYTKTVQQLRGYHDSLVQVQNVLLSFKLIGDSRDDPSRAQMLSQLLAFLVRDRNTPEPADEPKARAAAS
jgi:hypothetical protein